MICISEVADVHLQKEKNGADAGRCLSLVRLFSSFRLPSSDLICPQSLCLRGLNSRASQVMLVVKNPSTNAGDIRDLGSIPGSGRFPDRECGNPLQYSCQEKPMDRGA